MQKITLSLFLIILVTSRLYNLSYTARFTEDESGFLVRMYQIYTQHKITLIGHTDTTNTKVFSSLFLYLLLPVTILSQFTSQSMFVAAAIWGIVTGIVLLVLAKFTNPKLIFLSGLTILFTFPLYQTGRWAWNPNFIFLWMGVGLLCYLKKNPLSHLLLGISFGLAVHQHYYAIFATSIFLLLDFLNKRNLLPIVGFILVLLPFLLFDITHPPGIFLPGSSQVAQRASLSQASNNLITYSWSFLQYVTQNQSLAYIFLVISTLLIILDFQQNIRRLYFIVPVVLQFVIISMVAPYFYHYFFPVIPLFFFWLILPRTKLAHKLSQSVLVLLAFSGLLKLPSFLYTAPVVPDLSTTTQIAATLKSYMNSTTLPEVNIATLGSNDHTTHARKYRDLLLVPTNILFLPKDNYFGAQNLIVISTSDLATLKGDPAAELHVFRHLNPKIIPVTNTPWLIYHFSRSSNFPQTTN